ncbi:MAG: TonB family protein [Candidatus Omnitrophota bacterium]
MFKDRIFNLSILFSTVWHLFWISLIGIIVTPSVQPSNVHQEIDFLGPILEKTAFDLMVENVKPQAETLYASSALFPDKVYLKPKGPGRKVRKGFMPEALPDRFIFSLREYVKDTREIPLYLAQGLEIARRSAGDKKSPAVEGPAAERGIIFKPNFPAVPRGLYGDNEEYAVKLKFFVSDNGLVYDVEPVLSSGFPEIDMEATKFLKRWRFSPSGAAKEAKSRWGVVTITVEAR